MNLPEWKNIEPASRDTNVADDGSMAMAQVDAQGLVLAVSRAGSRSWGLVPGLQLPRYVFEALRMQAADVGEVYPFRISALFLLACRLTGDQGWLLFERPGEDPRSHSAIFTSLIENVPLLVLRARADGTLVYVNDGIRKILGYEPEEVLNNRLFLEVVHPDDRWRLTRAMREVVNGLNLTIGVRFQKDKRSEETRFAEIHLFPADPETGAEIEGIVFDMTDQTSVEEALFLSESLYRTFLEQSPLGVVHLDDIGTVTFENHRFRDLMGREPKYAWIGKSIYEIVLFGPDFEDRIRKMLESGEELRGYQAQFAGPDGLVFIELHGSAIQHPDGETVGGVLLVEDITERVLQQAQTARQEKYAAGSTELREVFFQRSEETPFLTGAVHVLANTSGADGVEVYLKSENETDYSRVSGWPPQQIEDEFLPVFSTRDFPALTSIFATNQPLYLLSSHTTRADELVMLESTGSNEAVWIPFFENGRPFGIVVFERSSEPALWDDAEVELLLGLTRTFEALWGRMNAEVRYQQTVAAIDECLFNFYFDKSGERRYSLLTSQVDQLVGFSSEEILQADTGAAASFTALIHPDDRAAFEAHDAMLASGKESAVTFRVRHKDGEIHWIRESASPLRDAVGRVSVGGILVDITEQKSGETALIEAKKGAESASELKSAFIATMSHEIRTPLGAVNGFSELLARELGDVEDKTNRPMPPQVTEFVTAIRENSQRLLALVNDLFDLANLEMGSVNLRRISVPLHEIVLRATSTIAVELSQKDVDLKMDLSESDPVVLGDPQRIQQVLENVLENAAKFTDKGTVTVKTRETLDTRVMIEVSDTGVGMSEDYVQHLFTPFLQEDRKLNRRFSGTGLGLALVRLILDRMNGEIEVESEKGEGSLFRIYLPTANGSWD